MGRRLCQEIYRRLALAAQKWRFFLAQQEQDIPQMLAQDNVILRHWFWRNVVPRDGQLRPFLPPWEVRTPGTLVTEIENMAARAMTLIQR